MVWSSSNKKREQVEIVAFLSFSKTILDGAVSP